MCKLCTRERAIQWLLKTLFWIFLAITILTAFYYFFIPTANEYEGEWAERTGFPHKTSINRLATAILRHIALLPENFGVAEFISLLNLAFLTIFIYKVGVDVDEAIAEDSHDKAKVKPYVYVEWAMGALISGVLFASSRINLYDPVNALTSLGAIVTFSLVSYYVLLNLRKELKKQQ